MDNLIHRLYSNSGWASLGRFLSIIFILLINGLVTRLLTPYQVGQYFLIFSLVTIATIAAQLGLNQAIVKLVSEHLSRGKVNIANYIAIRSVKTVLISVFSISTLAIIFSYYYIDEIQAKWSFSYYTAFLIIAWFALLTYQSILAECFRGYHNIKQSIIFGGVFSNFLLASFIATHWVIKKSSSIEIILGISALAILINLIFSQIVYNKITSSEMKEAVDLPRDVMSIAWPIWYTNLTLIILIHADIWIIGSFLSSNDVAIYGAAARLAAFIGIPLLIINSVISPVITDLYYKNNIRQLQRIIGVAATLASIPALLITSLYLIFGKDILMLVFGPFYSSSLWVLLILGAGQFFNVISGSCGLVLVMTGYHKLMLKITISTSLSAIILSIAAAFFLKNSIYIAIIFSSALIIQNILMLLFAYRRTGIFTFTKFNISVLKP